MSLHTQLTVRRGDFVLDAALTVGDGEIVALLGPNGSGKSTLLQAVAGLLVPESGSVQVNGRLLTRVGGDHGRVVLVPAHRRRIGLLGQDPLLFPHLGALENIAFGQRAQGKDATTARNLARDWLDAVGLPGFENRKPAALSGGQQQRVAIARALAASPDLLLLDEPMAALDVQNASLIRSLLRERLTERHLTTVLVTHDVVDAIVLADRVAILDDGLIVDVGEKARVLGEPVNRFAATLVGLNLLHGSVTPQGTVQVADGRRFVGHGSLPSAGTQVRVVFPPAAVVLRPGPAEPKATNSWSGTVAMLEPTAGGIRILLAGDTVAAEAKPADVIARGFETGSAVSASVDRAFVTVYRAQ